MLSSSVRKFTNAPEFMHSIEFVLNGRKVELEEGSFDPTMTLAEWLRLDSTGLKGTKIGCAEGGCGACTVLVSNMDPITKTIRHRSVNSCMMLIGQAHHQTITTIEGMGTVESGLNPIQKAIVEHHGTQCGYCTPGFVMNTIALLRENPDPTDDDIRAFLAGNLCRCSGYEGQLRAIRAFLNSRKGGEGRE